MDNWKVGTLIDSHMIASDVKSLTFKVDGWQQHQPGQHYSIKLTAPDGYQAERDYSIASPPQQTGIVELGIQLLEDGEVSPYLYQMQPGEQIELQGPIGGHFIWNKNIPGPLVLIGGGSGMVPLMSMLRYHYLNHLHRQVIFLISAKSIDRILYQKELEELQQDDPEFKLFITLTDQQPSDWTGYNRRIDQPMLQEILNNLDKESNIYVCGPTKFVESVADTLVDLSFNKTKIKTERFG